MRIVNVRGMPANSPGVHYCGRAWAGWPKSALANPCKVRERCVVCGGRHAEPADTVKCYREWLWQRWQERDEAVMGELASLTGGESLGCWCMDAEDAFTAEEKCHCVVIAKAWRWLHERDR